MYNKDGEHTMVATKGFSGMIQCNETAYLIVEQLRKSTSPNKITNELSKKFDAPKEIIYEDVIKIINQLREIGAINE